MQVVVTGKQLETGEALRRHVVERANAVVAKYFDQAIEAHVVFSREAHLFRADLSVHVGTGILVQAESTANEIYASFDSALERIDKQLRREKRRRRDHHAATPARDIADSANES